MTPLLLLLAAATAADPQATPSPPAPPPPAAPAPESLPPVPLVAATVTLPSSPGGTEEVALRRDGESAVGAAARFRVVAGAPLADARLVLYDAQESMVPAEEQTEIGAAMSRYLLAPGRPLRPGARYTLRLEGAAGREIRDLSDRRFRPLSFPLLVGGDPPAAEKPARKKARRKRAAQ